MTVSHAMEFNEIYSHSSHTVCGKIRKNNAFTDEKSIRVDLTKFLFVESKFAFFHTHCVYTFEKYFVKNNLPSTK